MSDRLEEIKQATREFYEKQRKLMKLMMELTSEETIEFHPWYMKQSAESLAA